MQAQLSNEQISALLMQYNKRKLYRAEYNKREEVIAKRKAYMQEYNKREEVIAKRKERNAERNALIKQLLAQHNAKQ